MKIASIRFRNFRCFRGEEISFEEYTSLVGPNNCGKSTVLRALNLLFSDARRGALITSSDFYVGAAADEELSLRFEFDDVVDGAAADLAHYVRNGKVAFELVAQRDEGKNVDTKCRGIRYGLPVLAPFFAADRAGTRRPIYDQLREGGANLPPWKNMEQAEASVRAFEAQRQSEHVPIPSDESAYGATGPIHRLRRHLDWIYVPAVKEVSGEASEQRNSAFSKLILLAVKARCDFAEEFGRIQTEAAESLKSILAGAEKVLNDVGAEIDAEFRLLSTSRVEVALRWGPIDDISVREPLVYSVFKDGRVVDSPDAFGHGLQRTYLMALLNLAAKAPAEEREQRLLLGIEEPELYQHPPQARFLANALCDLSEAGTQVVVTTHSPFFIGGRNFEGVRVLRRTHDRTQVQSWTIDEQRKYCAARKGEEAIGAHAALSGLDRSLQTNIAEIFFAAKLVLVEGPEDMAIISQCLKEGGVLNEFLGHGCHIVPTGGKPKMPMLIALARGFQIDVFCIFDFDCNLPKEEQMNGELKRYAEDAGINIPLEPSEDFTSKYFHGWRTNIQGSIRADCPSWDETAAQIAAEWGWSLKRMAKDPMLLSEAVCRLIAGGNRLRPLETPVSSLRQFWRA